MNTYKVKFKQAAHLDGKDYPRGTHSVPESAFKSPFFARLAKAGLVEDGEPQMIQAPAPKNQPVSSATAEPPESPGPEASPDMAPAVSGEAEAPAVSGEAEAPAEAKDSKKNPKQKR